MHLAQSSGADKSYYVAGAHREASPYQTMLIKYDKDGVFQWIRGFGSNGTSNTKVWQPYGVLVDPSDHKPIAYGQEYGYGLNFNPPSSGQFPAGFQMKFDTDGNQDTSKIFRYNNMPSQYPNNARTNFIMPGVDSYGNIWSIFDHDQVNDQISNGNFYRDVVALCRHKGDGTLGAVYFMRPGTSNGTSSSAFKEKSRIEPRGLLVDGSNLYVTSETSDGDKEAHIHKLTIPRYRPAKALKFLASKTYSSEAKGTSFRFFENLLGHYFVTDEFLLARGETRNSEESSAISLFYSPIASSDPKYVEDQISRIDNLVQTSKADTPSAMYGGAYKSEVLEIDLINRKTNLKRFDINKDGTNFIDSSGTTRKLSNDPHTEEFANDVFNFDISKRFHVIKTYQEPGDLMFAGGLQNDLYRTEIIQRRAAYNYHLHSHPVIINLKGRLDITAGRILDLDVQGFMSDNRADRDNNQLSGRYLVHSISHECKDDIVTTSARLSKFDWSK